MPNIDYYDSIQPLSKDKKWPRAEHLLIESLAMLIFSFLEHAIVSSTGPNHATIVHTTMYGCINYIAS